MKKEKKNAKSASQEWLPEPPLRRGPFPAITLKMRTRPRLSLRQGLFPNCWSLTGTICLVNPIRYQSSYTIRVNERTHSKTQTLLQDLISEYSYTPDITLNLTRCCTNMSNNLENFIIDLNQWNNTKAQTS